MGSVVARHDGLEEYISAGKDDVDVDEVTTAKRLQGTVMTIKGPYILRTLKNLRSQIDDKYDCTMQFSQ